MPSPAAPRRTSSRLPSLPPTAVWATLDPATHAATLAQISRMVRTLVRPAGASARHAGEEAARDARHAEDQR